MTARCRSCNAEIVWAVTAGEGKRIPLDAEPAADGNLEVVGELPGGIPIVNVVPLSRAIPTHDDRRRSHFATCPQASSWRRR